MIVFDDQSLKPIFIQIADWVEDEIIKKTIKEGDQIPSTNQFAAQFQINPATAGKGINRLVEDGIIYKKRGIGMFVEEGAFQRVQTKRRKRFETEVVAMMLEEAKKIGIDKKELIEMIEKQQKGEQEMAKLEARNVTKRFKKNTAVDGLNVTFETGRVYGLLGRNSAGKTTLLKLLTTQYLPDSGEVIYEKEAVYENHTALEKLCLFQDEVPAFGTSRIKHLLKMGKSFYKNWSDDTAEYLMGVFELKEDEYYNQLSKGKNTERRTVRLFFLLI